MLIFPNSSEILQKNKGSSQSETNAAELISTIEFSLVRFSTISYKKELCVVLVCLMYRDEIPKAADDVESSYRVCLFNEILINFLELLSFFKHFVTK